MNLTIAYITARKEPRFDWFLDSLLSPPQSVPIGSTAYHIIIVDFFKDQRSSKDLDLMATHNNLYHVAPKPTVWQGPHRLTSVDYFAVANARNTALCLAHDGWIAYIDDASVLMPNWVMSVLEAMQREHTVTLGAYKKVFELNVVNGEVVGFTPDPLGFDARNRKGRTEPVPCDGEWLYGCSLVASTEAFLSINGWDENCDGLGYEDVVTGHLLNNAGWKFVYDPRMLTLESQELHREPAPMKRIDPGVAPRDKSHAILHSTRMRKWAPNYWGNEELRGFRQRILNGEPFPNRRIPDTDWFTGQKLSEM